jgi:hypothetical protein
MGVVLNERCQLCFRKGYNLGAFHFWKSLIDQPGPPLETTDWPGWLGIHLRDVIDFGKSPEVIKAGQDCCVSLSQDRPRKKCIAYELPPAEAPPPKKPKKKGTPKGRAR